MTLRNTISLNEALRYQQYHNFSLLIKPCGSRCNLSCHYCYYIDKNSSSNTMSLETLEIITRQYLEIHPGPIVTFNWHGGEPLLAGISFYRKALEYQKKHAKNKTIENTLQTNGTLLNDEWAQFFTDNNFLLGVSIDGPKHLHDKRRRNIANSDSWEHVIKGLETLYKAGSSYNLLTTVNDVNQNHGLEVYDFLKKLGTPFIQFLPVAEVITNNKITTPDDIQGNIAPWAVSPQGYGTFLCEVFDHWVRHDVAQYYIGIFDATLAKMLHLPAGTCSYEESCGNNLVVENNGDVFCCDHFVYDSHYIGNITDTTLSKILSSDKLIQFGLCKKTQLSDRCISCNFLQLCHGGCPKHRFGIKNHNNYLCEGMQYFYNHTLPYFKYMAQEIRDNRAPANVMKLFKQ